MRYVYHISANTQNKKLFYLVSITHLFIMASAKEGFTIKLPSRSGSRELIFGLNSIPVSTTGFY